MQINVAISQLHLQHQDDFNQPLLTYTEVGNKYNT